MGRKWSREIEERDRRESKMAISLPCYFIGRRIIGDRFKQVLTGSLFLNSRLMENPGKRRRVSRGERQAGRCIYNGGHLADREEEEIAFLCFIGETCPAAQRSTDKSKLNGYRTFRAGALLEAGHPRRGFRQLANNTPCR